LLLSGCANLNLNKPAPKSNPTLPTVKNFKAYPDRNAMALYWSSVPQMSGYYIQRFSPKNKKWKEIAIIKDPYKSIYVDTNLKPGHIYQYKIATFNKNGIPSLSKEVTQSTMPKLAPVIILEAKPIVKGKIKLIFRPSQNERVDEYIIKRFDNQDARWKTIATLSPRLNVEYIDSGLKNGTIYKYQVIAKSFDGIKSFPSKTVVVTTFKNPPVITKINATNNLAKKIVLTFSPVKDAVAYKIYISSYPNGPFKFYKKIHSTRFTDYINKDGFIRYYKVTALSAHNTESLLNDTPVSMGQTLPKPAKPIVSTNITGNQVELIFSSPDHRAVKYLIIRKKRISLFKSEEKKFIASSNRFTDIINPKKEYEYDVYEIDKNGLISKTPAVIEVNN